MSGTGISNKIDNVLLVVLKTISITLFAVLTLILTANVLVRYVPVTSMHWLDEIVEMAFAGMVFYGAAAVWIQKGHFSAGNWIEKRLPSLRAQAAFRLFVDAVSLVFIGIFFKYSLDLTMRSVEVTAVFLIPKKVLYACMPISSLIMVAYSLKFIVLEVMQIVNPKKA